MGGGDDGGWSFPLSLNCGIFLWPMLAKCLLLAVVITVFIPVNRIAGGGI
jgi:hypothetical protein